LSEEDNSVYSIDKRWTVFLSLFDTSLVLLMHSYKFIHFRHVLMFLVLVCYLQDKCRNIWKKFLQP